MKGQLCKEGEEWLRDLRIINWDHNRAHYDDDEESRRDHMTCTQRSHDYAHKGHMTVHINVTQAMNARHPWVHLLDDQCFSRQKDFGE